MKNEYEIRGDVTAIFLKRKDGSILETLIDTNDLEKVQKFDGSWYATFNSKTKGYYAHGNTSMVNGQRKSVSMQRFLMDEPKGLYVDHINHDTLDNRRSVNLRAITNSQNMMNRNGLDEKNTSGYRGVTWHKPTNKWRAQIEINGKGKHLGLFENILDAAKAAEKARREFYATYSGQ